MTPFPEKTVELVPEPPSKDQLPSLPMDVLDSASAISAEPVKDKLSPNTARCPELRRENSWVSNSNRSGHASFGQHAFEDVRSGTPQGLNGPYPRIEESGRWFFRDEAERRVIDQPEEIFFVAATAFKITKNEHLYMTTTSYMTTSHPS